MYPPNTARVSMPVEGVRGLLKERSDERGVFRWEWKGLIRKRGRGYLEHVSSQHGEG